MTSHYCTAFQNICEMIKRALRTLMNDKVPILPDITALVTQMYQASPQRAMLELAKQVNIVKLDFQFIIS